MPKLRLFCPMDKIVFEIAWHLLIHIEGRFVLRLVIFLLRDTTLLPTTGRRQGALGDHPLAAAKETMIKFTFVSLHASRFLGKQERRIKTWETS